MERKCGRRKDLGVNNWKKKARNKDEWRQIVSASVSLKMMKGGREKKLGIQLKWNTP